MMGLYNVRMVYAADRANPVVNSKLGILAKNAEEAKLKAQLIIDPAWDVDYVTVLAIKIGPVKVKPKTKEVRNVT